MLIVPSDSKIQNDAERAYFLGMMMKYWNLPTKLKHFPGANPVALERKHIDTLKHTDFLVALKTDGVRYVLMMTVKPNSLEPIALMIDRALNMYEVEIWGSEDFFYRGSLFDGELVFTKRNSLQFIVFDVMLLQGASCIDKKYRERLQIIQDRILYIDNSFDERVIEQMLEEEDMIVASKLQMTTKKCVSMSFVKELWDSKDKCEHANDGIILTMNASPIQTGSTDTILKWKPCHTIDVIYRDQKLFVNSNNSDGLLSLKDHENYVFDSSHALENCVIECHVEFKGEFILTFERQRFDKKAPNTLHTVLSTLELAKHALGFEEVESLMH